MTHEYPTNITGILSAFKYANSITEGYFGSSIILVVFVVAFLAMKTQYPSKVCFAAASFLTMVLSIFFIVLGLIPPLILVMSIVLVVGGLLWIWFGDKQEY